MEASARILSTSPLPRRISTSLRLLTPNPRHKSPHISLHLRPRPKISLSTPKPRFTFPLYHNSLSGGVSYLSISTSSSLSANFQWYDRNNAENSGSIGQNAPAVTVVLLGWLGSTPKLLRRYVQLYNGMGFNAVTFVASVGDVLSFDLGRGVEMRVGELAYRLAEWAREKEEDGRERVLLFHTFSNTGWLAYGAILDNFQGRHDLLMKIKGCIVDSGPEPDLNPKVWAAGFIAAVLKKRSSLTSSAGTGKETNNEASLSKTSDEPLFIESVLLAVFEKLFSFLFNLPDVTRRLKKVLSTLTNNQPLCPQLYLYSTADKVIPYKSVEAFMEKQRKIGREVWSFNFGSSPHVDHFRTFPEIYTSQLLTFLEECLVTVKLT